MIPARRAKIALTRLSSSNPTRQFSSSQSIAAISPYKQSTQPKTSKYTVEAARRGQATSTATATPTASSTKPAERPVPSPAFNRDDTRWHDVQGPLRPYRQPEMDHSFVGMKGGEIVHEMMLRQGVKAVCES
jgi:acetolactate synthase I/II/III large subunit